MRFVDEKMEGFVTRIIDDEMIGVTGEDDFEIPVPASKVTSVHGYKAPGTKHTAIVEQQVTAAEFITKGIYLGVVADATIFPITAARCRPMRCNSANTSAATSERTAASKPPDVCGSYSHAAGTS